MLALAAFIVFLLAMFKVTLGDVPMLYLGLALLSLHFVFGWFPAYVSWPARRGPE